MFEDNEREFTQAMASLSPFRRSQHFSSSWTSGDAVSPNHQQASPHSVSLTLGTEKRPEVKKGMLSKIGNFFSRPNLEKVGITGQSTPKRQSSEEEEISQNEQIPETPGSKKPHRFSFRALNRKSYKDKGPKSDISSDEESIDSYKGSGSLNMSSCSGQSSSQSQKPDYSTGAIPKTSSSVIYRCTFCDNTFSSKYNARRHRKNVHKVK